MLPTASLSLSFLTPFSASFSNPFSASFSTPFSPSFLTPFSSLLPHLSLSSTLSDCVLFDVHSCSVFSCFGHLFPYFSLPPLLFSLPLLLFGAVKINTKNSSTEHRDTESERTVRIKIVRHTTLFDFVDSMKQSQLPALPPHTLSLPLCLLYILHSLLPCVPLFVCSTFSVLFCSWGLHLAGLSLQSTLAVKP